MKRAVLVAFLLVVAAQPGCGLFAMQKDHQALAARADSLEKSLTQARAEATLLRGDLEATRTRLDNALRANADQGTDLMADKARLNALAGRLDEATHALDEVKKELASTRTELDARLDEMKRAQEAQTAKPPPVTIPPDNRAHFAAIDAAYAAKDWGLTRTLGREFLNKYPTDDKADDVSFLMGDANLKDNRPSAALGEFNRVLKTSPQSNVLDRTLYAMGESYMLLRDCQNAKLAFSSCASRFAKDKLGAEAKKRIAEIDKAKPGTCGAF